MGGWQARILGALFHVVEDASNHGCTQLISRWLLVRKPLAKITLQHLMGEMDALVDYDMADIQLVHKSAGLVSTSHKLTQGGLCVSV